MGFLNAMLLFGTAAFAVPLGIHLLNRSRFYSVEWAAMHLLDISDQQNARRLEWRSLLLLLLRCLIPVVLAVCMARPMLQTAAVGGASGRSTTVLLLDDSFSVQGRLAGNGERASGWEEARADAERVVETLAGQAELSVVAIGGDARRVGEPSRRDPRPSLGALRRLVPQATAVDIAGGLRLASEILAESREPHRQVVLWSDFQRADWESSVDAAIESLQRQWATFASQPELHFIPLDVPSQANLSVGFDAASTEVTLPGEPLDLQLTLHNHGEQRVAAVPLRVAIDGRDLVARSVELEPQSQSQLLFTVNIEKPGAHLASVTLEDPAGQITADDADTLAIRTLPVRRVLLIEQEPSASLFACETGFLQLALEATAAERAEGRAAEVRRVAAREVSSASIDESDVVVLGNVTRLADEVVVAIERMVAEGGTLCVFAGESLDLPWYEQVLGPVGASPLLPWKYGPTVAARGAEDVGEDAASEGIQGGPYADPLLAFFDNAQAGGLEDAKLTAWRQLEPWADAASSAGGKRGASEALLSTDSGQPVLVAAGYGEGRVLQWSIAANESSGNLPIQPMFVPLMQRLLLLDLSSAVARHPEKRRQESLLAPLSAEERAALARRLGVIVHPSVESFLTHDSNRQGGREIWRWLLALVLVLVFAEMLLAGRLTRRGGR